MAEPGLFLLGAIVAVGSFACGVWAGAWAGSRAFRLGIEHVHGEDVDG